MGRPGIMLYFDILEPIRVLSDADKGRLLVAMLEYGQSGMLPEFDGMLALAWGFVKPKLDRDDESYEESKTQRSYAAFCKKRKAANLPKIPFEEWRAMDDNERHRMATEGNEPKRAVDFVASRYPTTTASTSTKTTTSASTAAAATTTTTAPLEQAAAAAQKENSLKVMHGKLGQGVVILTDSQVEDLLDRLGIDVFDHYVDKLSTFIINQGAKVANHYETILKWVAQDSALRSERERHRQTKAVPKGCGELGQAELEAIRRTLAEG